MSGTMSMPDLIEDLKAILKESSGKFDDQKGDFARHLTIAALDMGRVRERTLLGSITLQADVSEYDPPDVLLRPKFGLWGKKERKARKPWDHDWPKVLPTLSLIENEAGEKKLHLDPAPTAEQITSLGSAYKYYFFAGHVIDASDETKTTIAAGDRHLLLLRATVQSMLELANHGVGSPQSLGKGLGSAPRQGHPAMLAEQLMKEFERQAGVA